jgi:micrococcal nuclease
MLLLGAALAASGPASSAEVYRWSGDDGTVHFTDQPHPNAKRLVVGPSHWYVVERVLDGDTFILSGGDKVRLIGLNAPELAHRGDPAEPGGQKATRYLRRLIEGHRVRLEYGPQRRDRYGRRLAHVSTEDGVDVNMRLLRQGLAHAVALPPDVTRAKFYFSAEATARRAGRGIWGGSRFQIQPAAEAQRFRNTYRRLRGRVTAAEAKRKYTYLHFARGLIARLANIDRPRFAKAGRPPDGLVGRTLVVRGWIGQRAHHPFVRLRHPLQIEKVE